MASSSAPPDPTLIEESMEYGEFSREILETCLVNDAYFESRPIFYTAPMIMEPSFRDHVYEQGARVGALFDELCGLVWQEPELLDSFFHLPPFYKLMWLASEGWWHGFARMDMFVLEDGSTKICELNADTPSGQVECLVPRGLVAPRYPDLVDFNDQYEPRFWELLLRMHRERTGDDSQPRRAAILYPTDIPEDITLIRLYQRWFEERNIPVVLGAPMNLQRTEDGGIAIFGEPVDLVLRHYKTDWWGERPNVMIDDNPIPDPEPLSQELMILLDAERNKKVTVVNPFGALIPQDKLSMAFMWEQMHRFSDAGKKAINDLIPETRRLESCDRAQLKAEREQWVLKSDFGCEGDEVLVGPNVSQEEWDDAIDRAIAEVWVVQRYFRVKPITDPGGRHWLPNYGVFLIAGAPSGLLVRLAESGVTTGHDARVVTPFLPGDALTSTPGSEEDIA
jgi:glutathionylspermidine synthase